jgi:Fe-S cluster assembly protein SufD
MSGLLEFYQEQASSNLSTLPWLAKLQVSALRDFERYGFPGRKEENWKYTAMDSFLQQRFALAKPTTDSVTESRSDLPSGWQMAISNGVVSPLKGTGLSTLPEGVIIQPIQQALLQHEDKIRPWLGQLLQHEHGFHALNTAALQTGVFLYLPAGAQVDEPIILAHWQDKANQATHIRHIILAEEGSQATIIEAYQGQASCCYLTNVVTEVHMAPRSTLTHYKVQCESQEAFHIGHLCVQQEKASQFDSHSMSLGGKLVRSDLTITLQESDARCLLNGIYMPKDKQHVDQHTAVHHLVPDCQSIQDYKGVLSGQSRAVFNGKVVVAKNAQHTKAQQQNKNLLLSPQAEIDTKPQLDIYADDVACSHGATVGQLDEDSLFYMMTRGIERADAIRYLIHAFAADNLRLIAHSDVATWIANLINQQLR